MNALNLTMLMLKFILLFFSGKVFPKHNLIYKCIVVFAKVIKLLNVEILVTNLLITHQQMHFYYTWESLKFTLKYR